MLLLKKSRTKETIGSSLLDTLVELSLPFLSILFSLDAICKGCSFWIGLLIIHLPVLGLNTWIFAPQTASPLPFIILNIFLFVQFPLLIPSSKMHTTSPKLIIICFHYSPCSRISRWFFSNVFTSSLKLHNLVFVVSDFHQLNHQVHQIVFHNISKPVLKEFIYLISLCVCVSGQLFSIPHISVVIVTSFSTFFIKHFL